RKLATRGEVSADARTLDHQAGERLLLHAKADGARVVLENLINFRRLLAPARIDSVETLSVLARIIVELEARAAAGRQIVRHAPRRDTGRPLLLGFEVVSGQF